MSAAKAAAAAAAAADGGGEAEDKSRGGGESGEALAEAGCCPARGRREGRCGTRKEMTPGSEGAGGGGGGGNVPGRAGPDESEGGVLLLMGAAADERRGLAGSSPAYTYTSRMPSSHSRGLYLRFREEVKSSEPASEACNKKIETSLSLSHNTTKSI